MERNKDSADIILVYNANETSPEHSAYRNEFHSSLRSGGLQLEEENGTGDRDLVFIKIFIPEAIMEKFAGLYGIMKPPVIMKSSDLKVLLTEAKKTHTVIGERKRDATFSDYQRIYVIWNLMKNASYSDTKSGLSQLLRCGAYIAVYPPHDAHCKEEVIREKSKRQMLYNNWALPKNCFKKQPLDEIRSYLGTRIAFYFAWLEFYTYMLLFPSIFGFIAIICGVINLNFKDFISKEICDKNGVGKISLCPPCDIVCDYIPLHTTCFHSKMTAIFDSLATVALSMSVSIGACVFVELWKQRESELCYLWDLEKVDENTDIRHEFEESIKKREINIITGKQEPVMTVKDKAIRIFTSVTAVLLLVMLVLITIVMVVIYRISIVTAIYASGYFKKSDSELIASTTASVLNGVIITVLKQVNTYLSLTLTNFENPRTAGEYEKSITFKIFVFQAVNYYSPLLYVAFFKGSLYTYPGDEETNSSLIKRLGSDICDPPGCMTELVIQMVIIMIGEQTVTQLTELLFPWLKRWWNQYYGRRGTEHILPVWEEDYYLEEVDSLSLIFQFTEIVTQYGFVTMFITAFPMAPLFAFLNNVAEIHIDAFNMLFHSRRPLLVERVKGLEPWTSIISTVSKISVAMNAFIIAFTSDFIPSLVYKMAYSPDGSFDGFVKFIMSEFNTSDYPAGMGPHMEPGEYVPEICYYEGYREGPGSDNAYQLSPLFWHILAARVIFIAIFDHVVFTIISIVTYLIPEKPHVVEQLIKREKVLHKEKINKAMGNRFRVN